MKRCTDCGLEFAKDAFPIAKHSRVGTIIRHPRCKVCHRKYKVLESRAIRLKQKKKLLLSNDELEKKGKRVCSFCFKIKLLSEFRTRVKGRSVNKVCDTCLTGIYKSKVTTGLRFWRRRAYACNTAYRNRLSKLSGSVVQLSALPWICKPQDLAKLFEVQDGKCSYCSCELTTTGSFRSVIPSALTIDHKTPIARGGKHEISNLTICCTSCNSLKATMTQEEFTLFVLEYASRFSSRFKG